MQKVRNKLRIIGGVWRSRQIFIADSPGLRPTPDRVRETLFNWLQFDVAGSLCLDLFAGSGALGIEAASRGAKKVVQVENDQCAYQVLQENTRELQTQVLDVICKDVFAYLAGNAEPYDLVFLDPPFGKHLAMQCCQELEENGWLAENSKIYVETELGLSLREMPEHWRIAKEKKAGEVEYRLFQRQICNADNTK